MHKAEEAQVKWMCRSLAGRMRTAAMMLESINSLQLEGIPTELILPSFSEMKRMLNLSEQTITDGIARLAEIGNSLKESK